MDKETKQIRQEEKEYHQQFYQKHELFEEGTWLEEPIPSVMDAFKKIREKPNLRILDLGSGVGRHSIPIAKDIKSRGGKIVCVDLLEEAVENLNHYAKEYDVQQAVEAVQFDIGDYQIKENQFDFIIAVSSLEHTSSETAFREVLTRMERGTKPGGINCIIINAEASDEQEEKTMEIDKPTEDLLAELDEHYKEWEKINRFVEPLAFETVRDGESMWLYARAITYVVRKEND
ncbi:MULTISPECIES: class I SAM-dependent methyltransferase [Allobacillus]|uniref:Class I SAM-dependent methyltransferase n=1 Tax=Allobacillus salarius TaxID=1955272 RepID=A0A556PS71_9BACI|nr:class I SAM-dependent methyltransferase [Allobacillus salarius]TSJ67237.1 class I SAM-dependent methyltransferase [Allobacillus salarius]